VRSHVDPPWVRRASQQPGDLGRATFLALLVVVAVPALIVALSAGWRPVDQHVLDAIGSTIGNLRSERGAAAPAAPSDWRIADGWFFTEVQSAPGPASGGPAGYAVTDADGVLFWSEFQRLGGVSALGYPVSQRFTFDGVTYQAFQRAVLTFDPASGAAGVAPILDQLHEAQLDQRLAAEWGIPALSLPVPAGEDTVQTRVGWLLADYPAIQAYIAGLPDGEALLGLPTSTVQDLGPYYAVRFQKGVLQQWKEDVPWAQQGQVTAANVGEIAARLDRFPGEALVPAPPP